MNLTMISMNLTVHTYDIDIAGHVNNVVYIRWLEELRNKLLNKSFNFRKIVSEKFYPVVISTNIIYKKQLRIFDEPTGIIECMGYRHGVITLNAIIKLKDEIAAKAEQKCVLVDLRNSQMIKPKKFHELTNLE